MKRTLCVLLASLCLLLCLPIGSAALEQNIAFPMYPASRLAGMQTDYLAPTDETPGKSLNAGADFSAVGVYDTKNGNEGFNAGSLAKLTDGSNATGVKWFFPQTDFYDIRGNAGTADDTHIYKTVFAADLKAEKDLTALSIVISGAKVASALQAGDIYTSPDGESWTLAAGWDIVQYRQENNMTDSNGATAATKSLLRTIKDSGGTNRGEYRIALTGRARYVRIGLTAGAGKSNISTAATYAAALNAVTSAPTVYGISLWGYDTTDQIAVTNVQDTAAAGGASYNIRFLANVSMPSAAQKYGFVLTAAYTDDAGLHTVTRTYESNTVYTSVLENGTPVSAEEGYAWGLLTLTDIPAAQKAAFSVKPYLVLADGSCLMGDTTTYNAPGADA